MKNPPRHQQELMGLLARACERLVASLFAALDREGFDHFTTTQALAVRTLQNGPLAGSELAPSLGITPQAMSKVMSELERRGLAVRGHDARDARARPLALTEEGRRAADTMKAAELRAIELWRRAASEAALITTADTLRAYVEATDPQPSAPPRRIRFV